MMCYKLLLPVLTINLLLVNWIIVERDTTACEWNKAQK
jgi:hypothetical protein